MSYKLPVNYNNLLPFEKKFVREQYIEQQNNRCFYCGESLIQSCSQEVFSKKINWKLFPKNFLNSAIHLQHDHTTGMTEGVVHAYCNAVMWQYEGR